MFSLAPLKVSGSEGKESSLRNAGDPGLSVGWKNPLEQWDGYTPVFLPGEIL